MADLALVVVRVFGDRIEAELAQSALEAAGIESMVRADDMGGLRPHLALTNGVAVLVRSDDAQQADLVLRTSAEPPGR